MITLTDKATRMIMDFEGLNQPFKWPGGSSGITLGIGYDLGYVIMDQFESDWGPYLTSAQLNRLRDAVGKEESQRGTGRRDLKTSGSGGKMPRRSF